MPLTLLGSWNPLLSRSFLTMFFVRNCLRSAAPTLCLYYYMRQAFIWHFQKFQFCKETCFCKLSLRYPKGSLVKTQRKELNLPHSVAISNNHNWFFPEIWLDGFILIYSFVEWRDSRIAASFGSAETLCHKRTIFWLVTLVFFLKKFRRKVGKKW